MSLPARSDATLKRELKSAKFDIVGSESDIKALSDFLAGVYKDFNIDVSNVSSNPLSHSRRHAEIEPDRITIDPSITSSSVLYPRLAKALRRMSEDLGQPGVTNSTISLGELPLLKKTTHVWPVARVMDDVMWGSHKGKGLIPPKFNKTKYPGIIDELDNIVKVTGTGIAATNKFFSDLNPEWVYVQTVDVHPTTKAQQILKSKGRLESKEDVLARLDESGEPYPPGVPGPGYNQLYMVTMRGKYVVQMQTRVNIDNGLWKQFVKSHNMEKYVNKYQLRKPETVGEVLKVIFAFSTARTLDMKGAAVVPYPKGSPAIMTDVIYGEGNDPEDVSGYYGIYSGLVIGGGSAMPSILRQNKYTRLGQLSWQNIPGI